MNFEWDAKKAGSNLRKHGVSFFEAVEVFNDVLASTVPDPDHSMNEYRYLVVSYTERGNVIRIIAARIMTSRERQAYED